MLHGLCQENWLARPATKHPAFPAVALLKLLLPAVHHSFQQSDGQGQSQEVLTHWRRAQWRYLSNKSHGLQAVPDNGRPVRGFLYHRQQLFHIAATPVPPFQITL